MTKIMIVILPVLTGTLLGIIASIITSSTRQKESLTVKLLECFLEARKDLAHIISKLANLDTGLDYKRDFLNENRDQLAELYFKYYDFFPESVLKEMTLLKMALDRPPILPFEMDGNRIIPIHENELLPFIDATMQYENSKVFATMIMAGDNTTAKKVLCIVMHARRILLRLNEFSKSDRLLSFLRNLEKGKNSMEIFSLK